MSTATSRAVAAAVLCAALVGAGCGSDADLEIGDGTTVTNPDAHAGTVPERPADISGTVTSVVPFEPVTEDCTPPEDLDPDGVVSSDDPPVCTDADSDVVGTVLVEEQPDVQGGRKISFTVVTATVLTGGSLRRFDDLAPGQRVDAWSTGPCAESYPEQCTAAAIRATGGS